MPQRQQYPINNQWHQQALSPTSANRNSALRVGQNNLSPLVTSYAPDNPTNKNAPHQPSPSYQPAPCQPYQSNPPYCGYQTHNKKGVYQIDSAEFDDPLKRFYTMLEHETEEVQYSDKSFDEVEVNFVEIKSLCRKCGSPFSSKSLLRKYLKKGCTDSVQPLLPTSATPTSLIPIIELKAVVPTMGLGLAFRGWSYATAAVTLVLQVLLLKSDSSTTACLDTGCGVTLVDKTWLLRQLSQQKIKEMSTPSKVRGIGSSKHKSAQFAEVSLFLPDENMEGQ